MSKKKHITILSILFLVSGIISCFVAIGFLVGFPVLGSFIGDPIANSVLTYAGAGLGTLILVISIPSIIAGIGLIYHRPWARILGLIMCFVKLFSIPFGTILGIYGIWVLMNDESIEIFKN